VTLAFRLPFASQTLNHWDSVNHALALTSFNVAAHRPQPPGYVLYIAIARLVNLVLPDAQTALVVVSMLASALAIACLFLLGTRMASRGFGLIAAALLMTSPPFWFDGEVALPYVVEGCAGVALALLLYRLRSGDVRVAPLAAVVFAIAIGLRQQLALFFAPLVLYAYWRHSWRVRIEALAWFALVCALWFLPLAWSAGGLGAYFNALRNLNSAFSSEYALLGSGGVGEIARNGLRMGAYTVYALNLALIPLLIGGVQLGRTCLASRGRKALVERDGGRDGDGVHSLQYRDAVFLALWITPGVLFYLFFHMGSPGLIYVFLPALYLIAAHGLEPLTRFAPLGRTAAVLILCAMNLFIFLGTPTDLYIGREVRVLNYSALAEHDRTLMRRVETIRAQFDPQTTLVLATDWRFAEYYLPEYRLFFFMPQERVPLLVVQDTLESYVQLNDPRANLDRVKTIILYDDGAAWFYHGTPAPQCTVKGSADCVRSAEVIGASLLVRKDGVHVNSQ
jgi:4-amino-4-deoxy-L-arabinose transferase-like glycosyltransferase